jgi:hypothetical protein
MGESASLLNPCDATRLPINAKAAQKGGILMFHIDGTGGET